MGKWISYLKTYLLIVLVGYATNVQASAKDDFEQGAKYFKSGEYDSAVEKFENARKQGMKSVALYYNLGSSYYKLEDYKNARRYFIEVGKVSQMKSLANYNLGLIALKQQNRKQAVQYFKSVVSDNQDKKLVYLANEQLAKKTAVKKNGSVYLSAKLGYDDNINVAPADIVLGESDMFSDVVMSADYLLAGSRNNGWTGEAVFYRINYFDTDRYDQDQYGAGIKKTQQLGAWQTHLKVNFDKYTYGPDDYQSIAKMEAGAKRNLSKTGRLYLRYRYEDIASDFVNYDYLEGWRQKIRLEYRQYDKAAISQLYYELELNDRKDFVSSLTGNEYSYSPTRHTVRGRYTKILNKTWHVTGDLSYRMSDYPATATQDRDDDRWKAAAYVDYRFDKTMKLRTRLEYTDNDSTEILYDYDRTVMTVGLSKLF